jgi:hypothetical protein
VFGFLKMVRGISKGVSQRQLKTMKTLRGLSRTASIFCLCSLYVYRLFSTFFNLTFIFISQVVMVSRLMLHLLDLPHCILELVLNLSHHNHQSRSRTN